MNEILELVSIKEQEFKHLESHELMTKIIELMMESKTLDMGNKAGKIKSLAIGIEVLALENIMNEMKEEVEKQENSSSNTLKSFDKGGLLQ